MKKYIKWTGIVILFPFFLFIILCILIYIPPIQNFLVSQATTYSSKATGMKIAIERISLSFPLDLIVHNVQVADSTDNPILSVKEIKAEVQMLPLFRKEVELDGLTLKKASVNTGKLIEGMELNGELGEFPYRIARSSIRSGNSCYQSGTVERHSSFYLAGRYDCNRYNSQ